MEIRPRAVFEWLFGVAGIDPDRLRQARQGRYERSKLDAVTGDARRLSSNLGGSDRRKMHEYLEFIIDVERRIQAAE